jgi:thiol:disulfide interchange protein/DsbC/DsbD-like thiol-disulfide interchange protein
MKLWSVLQVVSACVAASAMPAQPKLHTTAQLLVEHTHARPGDTVSVGLWLTMAPKWHTYWKQAGDAGGPTTIRWSLPPGVSADTVHWPLPVKFRLADIVSYGYEDSTLLVVPIVVPANARAGSTLALAADVDWIECENICIPGKARVSVAVPVRTDAVAPSADAARFAAARAQWPMPLPSGARAVADPTPVGGYRLRLRGVPPLREPEFLVALPFHVAHAADQQPARARDGALTLTIPRMGRVAPVPALPGVLVGRRADGTRAGYEFVVPVLGVPAASATAAPVSAPPGAAPGSSPADARRVEPSDPSATPSDASTLTLFPALALAFLGGILLNLMPCVLPVMALKVFSFAELGGQDHGRARNHGLAFSAGVVATFLVLAGALLALRAGGAQLGWGFQLQSPAFVAGLSALLFVLGLSLLGVVEIGAEFTRLGAVSFDGGYAGSVANGVLATVVATPCTAPLMGAAIAFGLGQSPVVALAIFAALGLGMALPYAVLAAWPAALRALPKPGKWMLTMKRVLALPMFATVAWLAWVFVQQVGVAGLGPLAVALAATGVGAWLLGHASVVSATGTTRTLRRVAGVAFIGVGGFVAWGASASRASAAAAVDASAETITDAYGLVWEPWSDAAVAKHRAAGRPVFVDFTAAWCLTCKVNERVAFSSAELREAFATQHVALLRADWTSRSETIARAVASFGRQGIPLYVLYPASRERPYAVLPEVITAGVVLRYLRAGA